MTTSIDTTRVYYPTAPTVAHLLLAPSSPSRGHSALCGTTPGWRVYWRGTGNQAEYERAAKLPTCSRCAARL